MSSSRDGHLPGRPGPYQELFLLAALRDDAVGRESWARWKADPDARTAPGVQRLYPLAYRSVAARDPRDPFLPALEQHYRATWAANQTAMRRLLPAVQALQARGIPTLVLKGWALASRVYRDFGARVISDMDVLVPDEHFEEGMGVLGAAGWRAPATLARVLDPRFTKSINLFGPRGDSIDLHCHVLRESCEPHADDAFWKASVPITIAGVPTRTLCSTDHLLHVCIHGAYWTEVPHSVWIADAVTIVRAASRHVDWLRLVEVASARGVARPLADALSYLATSFSAEIPADCIAALRDARPNPMADTLHAMGTEGWLGHPVRALRFHWAILSRGAGSDRLLPRLRVIPDYLKSWCQTRSLREVPLELARRAARSVGFRLGVYRYPVRGRDLF